MKTAYIIARESADDRTLQNQLDALKKVAHELGYQPTKSFSDNVSGNIEKNDYQDSDFIKDLRLAINEKKPDAIFCFSIDRITRTTIMIGSYLLEFSVRPHIPIYFLKDKKWTINPETNEINTQYIASLSSDTTPQREREHIVARTRPAREKLGLEGYFIGHISDGYCVKEEWGTWDDGHRRKVKTIIIDEERRPVIEKIFELYLQGNKTDKIADILNADGVQTANHYRYAHQDKFGYKLNRKTKDGLLVERTKAKWNGTSVAQVLSNKWYMGVREYKGVELNHDAIIDKERWDDVQAMREERSKSFRSDKTSKKHIYLLSNLIYCGKCGSKLYGHYTGLNNHYYCSSLEAGSACGQKGICKENVEAIIYSITHSMVYYNAIIGQQNVFTDFFKIDKSKQKELQKSIIDNNAIIYNIQNEAQKLDKKIEGLIMLQAENYGVNGMKEKYDKLIAEVNNEIEDKKGRINKLEAENRKTLALLRANSNVKTLLKNIADTKDLSTIKMLFKTVINKVEIFNTESRNYVIRIYYKNDEVREAIYSSSLMKGYFSVLYEPLKYDVEMNKITSSNYPVSVNGSIIFCGEPNPLMPLYPEDQYFNSPFSVRDYILKIREGNLIHQINRLEQEDEKAKEQKEHYREWRKKYNTGKPTQEPYVIRGATYDEICLKRKHLYNRRYKIKNNKSLTQQQKEEQLSAISNQLNLLAVQVPKIKKE